MNLNCNERTQALAKLMVEKEWGENAWLLVSDYERKKAITRAELAYEFLVYPFPLDTFSSKAQTE